MPMQPRPRADTCRSWPSVRCCIAYPLAETRGQYGFPKRPCLLTKSRFDLPFSESIPEKIPEKHSRKQRSIPLQWDDARIFLAIARAGSLRDRKSTRLNSSHTVISYAVFCLKKTKNEQPP